MSGSATELVCLIFDGRRDFTATKAVLKERQSEEIQQNLQENIVVVKEPAK